MRPSLVAAAICLCAAPKITRCFPACTGYYIEDYDAAGAARRRAAAVRSRRACARAGRMAAGVGCLAPERSRRVARRRRRAAGVHGRRRRCGSARADHSGAVRQQNRRWRRAYRRAAGPWRGCARADCVTRRGPAPPVAARTAGREILRNRGRIRVSRLDRAAWRTVAHRLCVGEGRSRRRARRRRLRRHVRSADGRDDAVERTGHGERTAGARPGRRSRGDHHRAPFERRRRRGAGADERRPRPGRLADARATAAARSRASCRDRAAATWRSASACASAPRGEGTTITVKLPA